MRQIIKRSLIVLGLFFGLMHGEVGANDRDMMEMMELVVLSQKFDECKKNKDDKKRLGCFDDLTKKIKVQMKIFHYALDFTETAATKKKVTQGEHTWGKEFLTDVEKVIEKMEQYLE